MKTYITKKQAKEILLKKECKLNLPRMGRIILFVEPNNKIALGIAGEKLVGKDDGGYYFENWGERRHATKLQRINFFVRASRMRRY